MEQKFRLDVGCGENKQKGFLGMDRRGVAGVDIEHDITSVPWPLDDNSCEVVLLSHVVEHIPGPFQLDVMDEIWRVMDHDGLLIISTPYPNSFGWHQDPTHCASWNEATPHYFVPGNILYDVFKPKPWKLETITFDMRTTLEVAMKAVKNGGSENGDS